MRKVLFYFIGVALALLFIASCASIGHPSGGPRDEDPPRFLDANPPQGSVEVSPGKVVLTFDELVTVKDAFSKVVVSPPGSTVPRVSSMGRRVTVEFRDTLLPNTTYTVDFADAIADNNEGNKLENFFYTFSTGPVLDSLMVSGMVLGALDLDPAAGIYVGLHSNPEDSAFTKTRFDRIAKTDENGRFVIGGLAPGQYRIYALEDRDNDLAWSSPEETLAFYDTFISPFTEGTVTTDTIFNLKTGEVDTIVNRDRVRFLPNNILLRSYNTGYKPQYITNYERIDSTRLKFIFNSPSDSMPEFEIAGADRSEWLPAPSLGVTERSATSDTVTFWLRDAAAISSDTLNVAVRYLKADSVYNMVATSDTLRLITKRTPVKASKIQKNDRKPETAAPADSVGADVPPVPSMALKFLNGKVEVNSPIFLETPLPLDTFDRDMVRLETMPDSVWLPVEAFTYENVRRDTLNPRKIRVDFPWEFATKYRLTVDSLAGKGIYGEVTETFSNEFTIREENEYSSLKMRIAGLNDTVPVFVELLDAQGNPLMSRVPENRTVNFEYLLPAKYNVRLIVDNNGNGRWDPGNFSQGLQPDVSYYYPETVELKQSWSQELDWNLFSTPVDLMKPQSLRKKTSGNRR